MKTAVAHERVVEAARKLRDHGHAVTFHDYVNCYNEDMTPERKGMIDRANERLKELVGVATLEDMP